MPAFLSLLRDNANYRKLWLGQVVSEVGDHFNSIACLSLTLHLTGSGMAVGGVMIARTLPYLVAGPVAGVLLDRLDRRWIMLASDLARAVLALGFVLAAWTQQAWLLWVLSALLMFASPFFSSGRVAILPSLTSPEQLHTANALTQTTAWLTLTVGTFAGGASATQWGYEFAFVVNALSFLFSAGMIAWIRAPRGTFRAVRSGQKPRPWRDMRDGFAYMRRTPLVLAIGLAMVGWASGGGAAQILFTLFGEVVFKGGPAAIGLIWGFAGIGLVIGGIVAHKVGARLNYRAYKHVITLNFGVLGISYMLFSVMPTIGLAVVFITISRIAMGVNNVLNRSILLTHVPDQYRGRVFSTLETLLNVTMTASVAAAGVASHYLDTRTIGVIAGALSASTALFWGAANAAGWMPEPAAGDAGEVAGETPQQTVG